MVAERLVFGVSLIDNYDSLVSKEEVKLLKLNSKFFLEELLLF